MKRALAFAVCASLAAAPAAAQTVLKLATLAPEGSSWMNLQHEWQRAVESRTAGRVKVKFYAGGVMGDERDVLRKIKLGQISGAAITGIGLSVIDPEVRALDLSRTYEELDQLRAALGDRLRRRLEERGYVLLGWGDVGPIHLFSQKPLRTFADLRGLRLWVWSDDPISQKMVAALDVQGVSAGVPEVLPSLSRGSIDAFFGSPLAAVALQWSSHARYVTSMVMGEATGATVVAKASWDAIPPADQAMVREEADKISARLVVRVRADNDKAMQSMRARGIELVPTPPELQRELARRAEKIAVAAGASMSRELQDEVRRVLERLRTKDAR